MGSGVRDGGGREGRGQEGYLERETPQLRPALHPEPHPPVRGGGGGGGGGDVKQQGNLTLVCHVTLVLHDREIRS